MAPTWRKDAGTMSAAGVVRRLAALLVLLSALLWVDVADAGATTLHVAPDGSGTACTAQAPCGSLDQAYRTAGPGDTVDVAAGSYPGQTVSRDASKPMGSAKVTFRAQGVVMLNAFSSWANDVHYIGFRLPTPSAQANVRAGRNVVMEDFRAAKPYIWGVTSSSATGDTIQNVTIKGGDFGPHVSCGGGFQIKSDGRISSAGGVPRDITIDGATFHDFTITAACPDAHLDCLHSFNGVHGLTIKNSRFYRCQHFGMLINSASNVVIENNFIEGGIFGFKLRGDTNPSFEPFNNVLIRNNSADHISLGTSGSNILTNVRVEANAVIDRTNCRSGVTYAGNLAQQGSACSGDLPNVSSLGFANPAAGDFHIPLTSPAVNRLGAGPAADIDGHGRPQGPRYDIGADEVTEAGSPPPPPVPPPPPPPPDPRPGPDSGSDDGGPPGGDLKGLEVPWLQSPLPAARRPSGPKRTGPLRLSLRRVPRHVAVSSRGTVALRLACVPRSRWAHGRRCAGSVILLASRRPDPGAARRGIFGRAAVSIAAGRAEVVKIRLSRRAWKRVRPGHSIKVRLHATTRRPGAHRVDVQKPMKLVARRSRRP
jgi:Right handed beta helix region